MRAAMLVGAVALLAMLPTSNAHLLVGVEPDLANCGGTAPGTTDCGTGSHLRAGGGFFGPGTGDGCPTACNTAVPGYTGTLRNNIIYLVYAVGASPGSVQTMAARTWTCSFVNGALQGACALGGVDPPPQYHPTIEAQGVRFITVYDHTCESFNLGTTTPGGSGPFSCFAWHGLLT